MSDHQALRKINEDDDDIDFANLESFEQAEKEVFGVDAFPVEELTADREEGNKLVYSTHEESDLISNTNR
jgi:hypothetical protein